MRKNSTTIYASAARTATPTAVTKRVDRAKGIMLLVDVTAIASTPSVVVTIDGILSDGSAYTILTSAAITATGRTALRIYPGITAATNVAVSDVVPQSVRVTATHGNANSITYVMDLISLE